MPDELNDLALSRTFLRREDGALVENWLEMTVTASGAGAGKDSAALAGIVIDSKYKVLSLLGEGGMGSVYRVRHLLLNKEMALKTFRTANLSPDAWQRFQREAQAIGKLNHANIIQVFDFGIGEQNFPYYTMELLHGESLADTLAHKKRLEIDEALSVFRPVADGLAHAHKHGIVHRDVKPANIFLAGDQGGSVPRIVDFGLAKLAEFQNLGGQSLTTTGLVFGSPLYMSPEQSKGLESDQRTDIYSFGCSLFQALTGKPPFVGENFLATISMHQHNVAPSISAVLPEGNFPLRLQMIVAKLLAKDLEKRYQSFEDVGRDLLDVGNIKYSTEIQAAAAVADQLSGERPELLANGARRSVSLLVVVVCICVGFGVFALGLNLRQRDLAGGRQEQTAARNDGAPPAALPLNNSGQVQAPLRVAAGEDEALNKLVGGRAPASDSSRGAESHGADQSFTAPQGAFCHPGPNGSKIFSFPKTGLSYGVIHGTRALPARGEITFPRGTEITLNPGEAFFRHPELFEKFIADDMLGFNLMSDWQWGEQHFSQIVYMSGLQYLRVRGARLTAPCLRDINTFQKLRYLDVSDASVSGLELSRIGRLPYLKRLFINGIIGIGPVLDKIQHSQSLQLLEVDKCGLRDDDLKKIGTITELMQLSASYNDITANGIKDLSGLHNLIVLRITDNRIGPEVISTLGQFKKLQELRLETKNWPRAAQERLIQALPTGCKIEE